MIKNKLDYKLVNCALIMTIIFLLYKTGGLWFGIIHKLWDVMLPFIVAFILAYALYPLVKFFMEHKIPKVISIFLVLILVIGIVVIFGYIVVPLLFNQLGSLFNGIITFLNELSFDYDLDIGTLKNALSDSFNQIITWVS